MPLAFKSSLVVYTEFVADTLEYEAFREYFHNAGFSGPMLEHELVLTSSGLLVIVISLIASLQEMKHCHSSEYRREELSTSNTAPVRG